MDVLELARRVLAPGDFEQLVREMELPLDTSIRANLLKTALPQAMDDWAAWYGWEYGKVPFCPSGFWLRQTRDQPGSTISHRMGYYYIQEAASMLPVELFDFAGLEKPLILDMAASPGGKTTHLVDRTHDRGLIIANDASRSRITALEIVLRNWGAINQAVTCLPGEAYGTALESCFDAVLLDAPCSMQGLRGSESHTVRPVSLNEIGMLAARQKRLLESALRAVRPGGQVVYATCTLTAQENEEVLADLLTRFPRQVVIVDTRHKTKGASLPLDEFDEVRFPAAVSRAARLWPHNLGTAGFFCALLKKTDQLPPIRDSGTRRAAPAQPGYRALNHTQSREIVSSFNDQYGFNLDDVMQTQSLRLHEIQDQLFLIPTLLREKMERIPWISCGMLLGRRFSGSWQPSHEFVARFGDHFKQQALTLDGRDVDAWLRGEDLRGFSGGQGTGSSYWVVRDGLGRNLGRGKILSDRLKNLLPTRLF